MITRIYQIRNKTDGTHRLVRASNPSQALRHVASSMFEVNAATANAVATLLVAGIPLEEVSVANDQAE